MSASPALRSAVLMLAAAAIAASSASAVCNPPKFVSTYNAVTGVFSYWHTSLPTPGATLVANIWSAGGDHTGTCNSSSGILYFGFNPGDIGINFSLGDACVVGCPTGSLSIQATAAGAATSETLLAKALETPGGAVNFDFSQTGPRALGEYPGVRVLALSNVGPHKFNVNFAIDPPTSFDGAASEVTAFNVLWAESNTDPGRLPGPYTVVATVPSPGGGGVTGAATFQCVNNVFLVAQVVTAGGPSAAVSRAFRYYCGPILADPKPKPNPKLNRMGTRTDN